jgi:hypothetical protein
MRLKFAVISVMAVAMVLAVAALGHDVTDVALGCGGATATASGFAAGQYSITAKVYRDGQLFYTTATTITSKSRQDVIPFGVKYDTTGKHDWRVVFSWFADGTPDSKEGEAKGLDCSVPCHCDTVTVTTTVHDTTTVREQLPPPPAQTVTVHDTVTVPTISTQTTTVEKPVEKLVTKTVTKWKTKTVVKWKTRWKVKFQIKWRLHPDPYPTQCKCGPGERRAKDGKCHHIVRGQG